MDQIIELSYQYFKQKALKKFQKGVVFSTADIAAMLDLIYEWWENDSHHIPDSITQNSDMEERFLYELGQLLDQTELSDEDFETIYDAVNDKLLEDKLVYKSEGLESYKANVRNRGKISDSEQRMIKTLRNQKINFIDTEFPIDATGRYIIE